MNQAHSASIHQLLRSSQEIFKALDLPNNDVEGEVSSAIGIIEHAAEIIAQLATRSNELERLLTASRQELADLEAKKEESAQRLAIAEEAIRAQSERADRAERLINSGFDKAKRLEQQNHDLSCQLERMVKTVTSALSPSKLSLDKGVGATGGIAPDVGMSRQIVRDRGTRLVASTA